MLFTTLFAAGVILSSDAKFTSSNHRQLSDTASSHSLEVGETLSKYSHDNILRQWRYNESREVCTCNSRYGTHSGDDSMPPSCIEAYHEISNNTFHKIMTISKDWKWPPAPQYQRPQEAFQQSLLHRGDPSKLVEFTTKLKNCVKGDKSTVSVVVFGGSETAGSDACNIVQEDCPWSNQLKNLLVAEYPQCDNIDVYNHAAKSTYSLWALDHMHEIFTRENGAHNGKPLGEVVDLVIMEYGVNDGFEFPKMTLPEVEAVSEYIIKLLLRLPNKPAVIYAELTAPNSPYVATPYHYEAASRFGIPVADITRVMSFPDDPRWIKFDSKNKTAFYPVGRDENGTLIIAPKPNDYTVNSKGVVVAASHAFKDCWGKVTSPHPVKPFHYMISMILFYFIQVETEVAAFTLPLCKKTDTFFGSHFLMSPIAIKNRKRLDPTAMCPKGILTEISSMEIASDETSKKEDSGESSDSGERDKPPTNVGPNEFSRWRLIEDRPNKFGWVIRNYQNQNQENKAQLELLENMIQFDIILGESPIVTLDYMHTYKDAGKVQVSINQTTSINQNQNQNQNQNHHLKNNNIDSIEVEKHLLEEEDKFMKNKAKGVVDGELLTVGSSLIIDSYQPLLHFSQITQYEIHPFGFLPGPALLQVLFIPLSESEKMERGGDKFKLESISSC